LTEPWIEKESFTVFGSEIPIQSATILETPLAHTLGNIFIIQI
jgi:hypothetical protein